MSLTRFWAVAVLLATGVVAMAWSYSYGGSANPGILDRTGPAVTWGLPAAKLVFNLASAGTIGALVLAVFALPRGERAHAVAWKFAGWSAVVWAVAAAVHTGASFLLLANRSVAEGFGPAFFSFLTEIDAGRSGALAVASAAAVACLCFRRPGPRLVAVTLLLAFAGLIPLVLKSHATGGAGHADSTTSVVVHMVTAAVWLGGLLTLIVVRPALPGRQLSAAVRRYSTLALICFIALAGSGFLAAWTRVNTVDALLSPYGLIVLAKTGAFLALGLFGALHRRWSLNRLQRDPGRGGQHFIALAVAELAVMGAASGMAAALARTEPPTSAVPGDLRGVLPAPQLWEFVSRWAPDPLWSLACGFAVFFYLAGIRRLETQRQSGACTALWLAGVTVLFVVTNGGLHIYQGYLFNAHVLTQMMLVAVVPLLLVPAAPLTLAELAVRPRTDGSTGAGEMLLGTVRPMLAVFQRGPLDVVLLLAGCLFATYYTPLLEWAARGQAGYSAATLLTLFTGCLVTAALIGSMAPGRRLARGLPMAAGLAVLYAFSGWKLSTQALDLERPWYVSVGRPWGAAPLTGAELGGTIIWTVAAVSLAATALWVIALQRGARTQPPDMLITERDAGRATEPVPHMAPSGSRIGDQRQASPASTD